ncbi:hypothetical protein LFWB_6090 [Candidatus Phytoplasma luffae]|uniref:Uncharacterized protein n=1 Tax=Loofah witches'-broom phytoplasma TaxID=35773 RepID=A0A975IM60_LOWBP|nr:hypothetical protein [Candidatus Phytoplasma luffae]QTX03172.1 hypothetical protein LFWB_6090 [Candidatus Phytoplasma luffae]
MVKKTNIKKNKLISLIFVILLILLLCLLVFYFFISEKKDVKKDESNTTSMESDNIFESQTANEANIYPEVTYKLPNEVNFFKKIKLNDTTEKNYYQISDLVGKQEDGFRMYTKHILNILTKNPIIFYLKNDELKTDSSINLLQDLFVDKNLYEYKNKPNLYLKIIKQKSLWGAQTNIQVQLLSEKEILLVNNYSDQIAKMNLVTTNLTLYKNRN